MFIIIYILFYSVGKIELPKSAVETTTSEVILQEVLSDAYYNKQVYLVYLSTPPVIASNNEAAIKLDNTRLRIPGMLVDEKTTYELSSHSLSEGTLNSCIHSNNEYRIRIYPKQDTACDSLRRLAMISGEWSRFRVDTNIRKQVYDDLFCKWIDNSVNRSLADEVFVAQNSSGENVGFVTVKRRGNVCNIGLLAVSSSCRRQGVAKMLLSRAALWVLETEISLQQSLVTIVTQGSNIAACSCYESFGFMKSSIQNIHHIWLPQGLIEPSSRILDAGARIPFCKQYFTGNEIEYVTHVLSNSLDSAARYTTMCSTKLKEFFGANCDRVVMVPSGTAALEMAALLANIEVGDEVIMPSYTFSSTANAFVLRGAVPVFVDIRPDTLNIDEKLIEAAITSKTKAIVPVHYAGIPCEMDEICAIAKKYGLFVIEDAAQAFMTTYKGKIVGTIGHFGCFSFHYTKNIICGEGGCISINKVKHINSTFGDYSKRSLVLWEKGTNRYDFMAGKVDKYFWVDLGSSYVPNEVSCAILFAQLEKAQNIMDLRLENYATYERGLLPLVTSGVLRIPKIPDYCHHNAHIFFVIFNNVESKLLVEEEMKKKKISLFAHYIPLHSAPAGLKYGKFVGDMKVTDEIYDRLLRLPLWVGIRLDEIKGIIEFLIDIVDKNKDIFL